MDPTRSGGSRTVAGYLVMLLLTAAGYLALRGLGQHLAAPSLPSGAARFGVAGSAAQVETLLHVLVALATVIVAARAVGALFGRLAQPPVVGEIIAGILLGPSLLGRVAPNVYAFLLPAEVAPFLGVLAQVGVILYMFLVGLELDPSLLRRRGHSTIAISHASIVVPFLFGAALALLLYPRFSSSDVPFTAFSLFLGVSMSVTAFPVLARILTDRRIHKSDMGVIALACAAIGDVTAWSMLAFVVSVARSRLASGLLTVALAAGYIAVMIFLVRPLLGRLTRHYGNRGGLTQGVMAAVLVLLLLSSLTTELIGIHAVFGAFALGAAIPHDSGLARDLTDRLEDLVVVLLLPAFFAFTGMRTQIGLVAGASQWLWCGAIIVVASVGKFGGSVLAARLTGMGWRPAAALGVLMNTRGLMELIVLHIGIELKVLSPPLFAMMVVMAVVTTVATTPLLQLITRGMPLAEAAANRPASAPVAVVPARRRQVLLPVSNPAGLASLVDLATAASPPGDPPPKVLALVRRPPGGIRSGLHEQDDSAPPRATILEAAVERAREAGRGVDAQAVWTDDPASDILRAAADGPIGWLFLGYHRPVFGGDLLGGVVKEVLDRAREQPVAVAVVIHGHERPIDRVVAVVDESADGRAALDLATRIARARPTCSVHALLVGAPAEEPGAPLVEAVRAAAEEAGRWLHTDVLRQRNPAALAYQTHADLVIVGMALTEELGLPLDDDPGAERCMVVVRGPSRAARPEAA